MHSSSEVIKEIKEISSGTIVAEGDDKLSLCHKMINPVIRPNKHVRPDTSKKVMNRAAWVAKNPSAARGRPSIK